MADDPFVTAAREALDDALGDVRASIEGAPAAALNWRPTGGDTNSIAALGVHAMSSTRSWLAVAMGAPLPDATATASPRGTRRTRRRCWRSSMRCGPGPDRPAEWPGAGRWGIPRRRRTANPRQVRRDQWRRRGRCARRLEHLRSTRDDSCSRGSSGTRGEERQKTRTERGRLSVVEGGVKLRKAARIVRASASVMWRAKCSSMPALMAGLPDGAYSALRRHHRHRAAAVLFVRLATHEAPVLDAVEQAGEAAPAQQHSVREIEHAHAATRLRKLKKDVVPGERKLAGRHQLLLEDAGQRRMCLEDERQASIRVRSMRAIRRF